MKDAIEVKHAQLGIFDEGKVIEIHFDKGMKIIKLIIRLIEFLLNKSLFIFNPRYINS